MQPLYASGTADASGDVTLTFQAPGMGRAVAGTVSIPGATSATKWTAHIGGAAAGSWVGITTYGPLVASDSETLAIKGTGLVAGSQVTATWNVTQGPTGSFDSVVPAAMAPSVGSYVEAATQAGSSFGTVNASAQKTITAETTTDTVTLIPAPSATEQLQLFNSQMVTNTSGTNFNMVTTDGTNIGPVILSGTASTPYPYNFEGIALSAGVGVNLTTSSGSCYGTINYSVISS